MKFLFFVLLLIPFVSSCGAKDSTSTASTGSFRTAYKSTDEKNNEVSLWLLRDVPRKPLPSSKYLFFKTSYGIALLKSIIKDFPISIIDGEIYEGRASARVVEFTSQIAQDSVLLGGYKDGTPSIIVSHDVDRFLLFHEYQHALDLRSSSSTNTINDLLKIPYFARNPKEADSFYYAYLEWRAYSKQIVELEKARDSKERFVNHLGELELGSNVDLYTFKIIDVRNTFNRNYFTQLTYPLSLMKSESEQDYLRALDWLKSREILNSQIGFNTLGL